MKVIGGAMMKIKFKKEVEKKLREVLKGLEEIGVTAHIPHINTHTNTFNLMGDVAPIFETIYEAEIKFKIPDDMVEIEK